LEQVIAAEAALPVDQIVQDAVGQTEAVRNVFPSRSA